MNYEHPELMARLADEYVLGTLRGPARRRFERLMDIHDSARNGVRRAEERMLGLSFALTPLEPAHASWLAIAGRVGFDTRPRAQVRPRSASWRMALAAVVAMAAIGIAWVVVDSSWQPTQVASLAAKGGAPLWAVESYTERGRLRVKTTGTIQPQPGRSYELWALPEGGAPVSLGLMPETGDVRRDLNVAQLAALRAAKQVAVSLEPAGGSKTGAPTGPVLFVAELRAG